MKQKPPAPAPASPLIALLALGLQVTVLSLFLLFVAENRFYSNAFVSTPVWEGLLLRTGGKVIPTPTGLVGTASVGLVGVLASLVSIVIPALIAWARHRRQFPSNEQSSTSIAFASVRWTAPLAVWLAGCLLSLVTSSTLLQGILILTPSLALSVTLAGWIWEIFRPKLQTVPSGTDGSSSRWWTSWLIAAIAAYTIVFTALNWGLWFDLQIPHGDSSMYEEHLWNVLHGKGFRSYLDQGLFLGEHIQVVHLLLLPVYILWPSHLLLELAQSLIIALTAIPVYRIALRHGGSPRAALLLAMACLLYFPLQYLDIAIDLKTFRPSAFGIPTLLCAIDALERRRWGWMTFWFALTLSSQEDFAIVIALLGLWQVAECWPIPKRNSANSTGRTRWDRPGLLAGSLTFVLSTAYLVAAVKYIIPWFRSGETVHYVRYFEKFGKTAPEVVWNIIFQPQLLLTEMTQLGSVAYLLMLLIPLGIPWRAWSRLLVGLPLYVLLCLNQVAQATPGPFHHFHAPLIPIVLWAACAGLQTGDVSHGTPQAGSRLAQSRAIWIFACALTTQLFYTFAPTGLAFWDPGHRLYWKSLYIPDDRAHAFEAVYPLIPLEARVASTDFVHPRFTHHLRSYDYSDYPRKVANYLPQVPDDTDYIIIDTAHPYSVIRRPEEMREIRQHPEQWEIVPVDSAYYIVLKRVRPPSPAPSLP